MSTHYFANNAPLPKEQAPETWVKLLDFGEYPHPEGLQVVDETSAKKMLKRFKSILARLARTFSGLPVYIGHPDDAAFKGEPGHTDTQAYAWVKDMKMRGSSLWVCIKWSKAGLEILEEGFYTFLSPRWTMEPIKGNQFRPIELISIGLTNTPNIPSETIANPSFSSHVRTLKTISVTHHLTSTGNRPRDIGGFIALVNARMASTSEPYHTAWVNVKKEYPEMYLGS